MMFSILTIISIIMMISMIVMHQWLVSNLFTWSITSIIFILILLLGLYHEWNQGMMNWSN